MKIPKSFKLYGQTIDVEGFALESARSPESAPMPVPVAVSPDSPAFPTILLRGRRNYATSSALCPFLR